MHPILKKALDKAQERLAEVSAPADYLAKEQADLMKLTKTELVEQILHLKYLKKDSNKGLIQEAAYAILEDPDCVWLDYGTIAALIRKQFPWAETADGNISWYSSMSREKDRKALPRKPHKELAKLLLAGI